MADSPYIVEVTAENFRQVVLEGSFRQPVLVDFWASWCQPCKILLPILTRLANEYGGKFLLAKLNTEEQQQLAAQFGIRSIPTLKLFAQGAPVDEFMGALPEAEIRAFLDRNIPRESDGYIAQAQQMMQAGQDEQALQLLLKARELDPGAARVEIALAQVLTLLERHNEALAILDALPLDAATDPAVQALRSQLEFAAKTAGLPSIEALQQRLAANERDSEARYQLGNQLVATGEYEQALEQFLTLLRLDRQYGEDAARKSMLQLFEMLGDHPLVGSYRGKLARLLY